MVLLQSAKFTHIWSSVGVMYRIRLIKKNGTCNTEFAMKSRPPTILSSQVTESKFMKFARVHNEALAATIYVQDSVNPSPISLIR